jgi:hypothetical protein
MAYDAAGDIRLDPRLKAILASMPAESGGDVDSRETLLAEANSDAARRWGERLIACQPRPGHDAPTSTPTS